MNDQSSVAVFGGLGRRSYDLAARTGNLPLLQDSPPPQKMVRPGSENSFVIHDITEASF